jgi:hypothetical protein
MRCKWETDEEEDDVALCFDSQGQAVDFVEDVLSGNENVDVLAAHRSDIACTLNMAAKT